MAKLGKNTANVTANLPQETKESLAKLAEESGMSLSAYTAQVLTEAARSGAVYQIQVIPRRDQKVAEDPAPYGTRKKNRE